MDGFLGAWRHLRPWSQPAIYIGAAVIAAIWASVSFNLAIERERSLQSSIQSTGNLARVFEENIVRTLMEADRAMVLLRSSYQQNGNFDLAKSLGILQNDLLAQIRIVGPDGVLIPTNTGPISAPLDVRDREYFQVQQDSSTDELFISKPILGRTRGIWLLQLSRPIRGADGSFQGVIVASLDPRYLAKFYQSIDVGHDGAIFLAGLDGVVRASAGFKSDVVGSSMLGSNLFKRIKQANAGWFLTSGNLDGVTRFVSYQVVKGFPLVVYVGQSEQEVLAIYRSNQKSHYAVAGGATLLIVDHDVLRGEIPRPAQCRPVRPASQRGECAQQVPAARGDLGAHEPGHHDGRRGSQCHSDELARDRSLGLAGGLFSASG